MGAIVFLWILLVVVAFVNHQYTLVGWVLGATFVLFVVGAMIHASSEEKAALERVKREKQDQDRVQPSPVVASPPQVHQTTGHRAATAGAMLLLGWCLTVAVAVGAHHAIPTLWVVGVSIVVLAAAITMIGSGKKQAAPVNVPANVPVNTVRQGVQDAYRLSKSDRAYVAYQTARSAMEQRLRFLELKYPLDLSKEQTAGQTPIESALQHAEVCWKSKDPFHPYLFFRSEDNINVLQMWLTDEDLGTFWTDGENLHRCWVEWMWVNRWLPEEKVEHAPDERFLNRRD